METIKPKVEQVIQWLDEQVEKTGRLPEYKEAAAALSVGFNTISQAMKSRNKRDSEKSAITQTLPDVAMSAAKEAAALIWSAAKREMDEQLKAAMDGMQKHKEQLEEQLEMATQAANQLEDEVQTLVAQVAALQSQVSEQNAKLAEAVTARAASESALAESRKFADSLQAQVLEWATKHEKSVAAEMKAREDAAELRGRLVPLKKS